MKTNFPSKVSSWRSTVATTRVLLLAALIFTVFAAQTVRADGCCCPNKGGGWDPTKQCE